MRQRFCGIIHGGLSFIPCPVFWKRVVLGNIWNLCKVFPFYLLSIPLVIHLYNEYLVCYFDETDYEIIYCLYILPLYMLWRCESTRDLMVWYCDLWGMK
jgi:hypothetical protein